MGKPKLQTPSEQLTHLNQQLGQKEGKFFPKRPGSQASQSNGLNGGGLSRKRV